MHSLRLSRGLAAAIVLTALAGGLLVAARGSHELRAARLSGVDLGVVVDPLSMLLLGFVGCVGWLVSTYSLRNLRGQDGTARFGWLLIAALLALALLVSGASIPLMAVGWTASGLAVASLVAHAGHLTSVHAARYVRRTLLLGDAALWSGVVAAVVFLPTVNRPELADASLPTGAAYLVALPLVVACIVRSALAPAHSWLPETAEAPSPVSAFLHAGVVNGTGLLVSLLWPLFLAAPGALVVLLLAGTASVAVGTLASRARADVKGQLACSTTAQMGYMAVQLGLGLPAAAVLHLVGHGFYKGWLFLRAGGAVTRSRSGAPAPAVRSKARSGAWWLLPALTTLAGAALAAPAVARSVQELGVTGAAPAALALVTAAVATAAVARRADGGLGARAAVGVAAAVATGCYAWTLGGWERLLSASLPLTAAWSPAVGTLLVVATAAVMVTLPTLVARMAERPDSRLAVWASASALPPWSRRFGGRAPTLAEPAAPVTSSEVEETVRAAAEVCAPAWPLRTLVAANPLAGLETMDFGDAAEAAHRLFGTRGHLPPAAYLDLFDRGRITRDDLAAALRELDVDLDVTVTSLDDAQRLDHLLEGSRSAAAATAAPVRRRATTAEVHAAAWTQRAWARAVDDSTSPWQLWRAVATSRPYDRVVGVAGASRAVRALPADPVEALAHLLGHADRAGADGFAYVTRLLASAPGWAAHAHWRARQLGTVRPLVELVALRAAIDILLAGGPVASGEARPVVDGADMTAGFPTAVWQRAYENGFRAPLVHRLGARAAELVDRGGAPAGPAPEAQLVFCIDVRSERIRRALETAGPYETLGFAGFFGAMMAYESPSGASFEQCPALVRPTFTVRGVDDRSPGARSLLRTGVLASTSAPVTPLLVAEAGGALAALAGLAQTVVPPRWNALARSWGAVADGWGATRLTTRSEGPLEDGSPLPVGMTVAERVELATGALTAMGLTERFAPVLVICAHAASLENNAFAAAYDCGACGGNGGQVNARVLAEVLNDPAVRERLAGRGIVVPPTTVAVAAVHDTTTDCVQLDPAVVLDAELEQVRLRLERSLQDAAATVRAERVAALPGTQQGMSADELAAEVARRASDWAQPCPEWGLAGNAAFVVGPRELTRALDLQGRVFLHSYRPDSDPDGSALEAILTAPAVVTQWINAQYYASTVDHQVFGAGDKSTHNVVGDVGVLTGAHGDLRLGLPWQALFSRDPRHDEDSRQHEPLRQLVVVWARPHLVSRIVERHASLQQLFINDWMSLAAIDPDDGSCWSLTRSLTWRPWEQDHLPTGGRPHERLSIDLAPVVPTMR